MAQGFGYASSTWTSDKISLRSTSKPTRGMNANSQRREWMKRVTSRGRELGQDKFKSETRVPNRKSRSIPIYIEDHPSLVPRTDRLCPSSVLASSSSSGANPRLVHCHPFTLIRRQDGVRNRGQNSSFFLLLLLAALLFIHFLFLKSLLPFLYLKTVVYNLGDRSVSRMKLVHVYFNICKWIS